MNVRGARPLSRPDVRLPVRAMQTYRVASPRSTHTRPATCAEYRCKAYLNGWPTIVPAMSLDGNAYTADYVRKVCRGEFDGIRRPYLREVATEDGLVKFVFDAGVTCFRVSRHRVSLERPEFYLVRGGDWRANTGLIRRHTGPRAAELWVEDSQETFDRLRRRVGV